MFDVWQATMDKEYALGEQRGIALGEQRGIALGEQRGIALGEQRGIASMKSALMALYEQGREEDVKRALSDSNYLEELLRAYKE